MTEIWKQSSIPNVEVSNTGKARNAKTGNLYALPIHPRGYVQLHVSAKGKKYSAYIHRLVIEAFITMDFQFVDHIDGCKTNNHLTNLRPCNKRQNQNYHVKSPHPGASFDKENNRWVSSISIRGKNKNLGRYSTAEEASAAYIRAANELNEAFI